MCADTVGNLTCLPGPVNTMRMPIDGGHFLAGQGALSAMYLLYTSEVQRGHAEKWPRPCGLALQ